MIEHPARETGRRRGRLDWRALLIIVVLFAAALLVSRSCQQAQVRISKEQAIATARKQVDFTPQQTQIRLLRQGLNSKPFWAVSLSIPADGGAFRELVTVLVDANTGTVADVNRSPGGG